MMKSVDAYPTYQLDPGSGNRVVFGLLSSYRGAYTVPLRSRSTLTFEEGASRYPVRHGFKLAAE